jgi:hypothetical protein
MLNKPITIATISSTKLNPRDLITPSDVRFAADLGIAVMTANGRENININVVLKDRYN